MSEFLKSERNRLNLKQSEVSEKISVGIATYIRWEGGKPIPSDKLALLGELGFDVQFIVTGNRSSTRLVIDNEELLNPETLTEAIETVMNIFDRINRVPRDRKHLAQIITAVYELYIENGRSSSQEETILRLIKAAS